MKIPFLSFILCFMFFIGIPINSNYVSAEEMDVTPPVLESIEVSPKEVSVGETVLIKAKVNDDLSEVNNVYLDFLAPSSGNNKTFNLHKNPDGLWEVSYTIKSYDEIGTWKLFRIVIFDSAGKPFILSDDKFPSGDLIDFTINASEDSTPPVLESIEVSPMIVKVGETVLIKAKITDDMSGVNNVSVTFYAPSSINKQKIIRLYPKGDGLWEGSYTVQAVDENGVWELLFIYLTDNAENSLDLNSTSNNLPDKFNININIDNENGDSSPPVLEGLEVSPLQVQTGKIITAKAKVTDDFSGVDRVSLIYRSSSSETDIYIDLFHKSGDLWEGSYRVKPNDQDGTWNLNQINLMDKEENMVYMFESHSNFPKGNKTNFTISNMSSEIDYDDFMSIYYNGSLGVREEIGFTMYFDENLKLGIVNGMNLGMEIYKDEQTLEIGGTILNKGEFDENFYAVFNIPDIIESGTWKIKKLKFLLGDKSLNFSNFNGKYLFSDKFFIPEVKADEWVRSVLRSRLFTDDADGTIGVTFVGGGYMPINSFIQKYQFALPPYSKEVTYNRLMKYASKTGDPMGDEINLYSLYKKGLINSEIEPRIPIQVYNFANEISLKNTKKTYIFVTEVLHYLSSIHDSDNKITAYIVSPKGKEYKIDNFVYDDEFEKFDLARYQKGGWIGNFEFPNNAVNGEWKVNKVILETKNENITFMNGRDFYEATFLITGGRDYSPSRASGDSDDTWTDVIDEKTQKEYKLIGSKQKVKTNKEWSVNFTLKLDESTINNETVLILNNGRKVEDIKVSLSKDKRSIIVEAPKQGYKKGEKYTLFMSKGIKSATGKAIHAPVKFEFTIED